MTEQEQMEENKKQCEQNHKYQMETVSLKMKADARLEALRYTPKRKQIKSLPGIVAPDTAENTASEIVKEAEIIYQFLIQDLPTA